MPTYMCILCTCSTSGSRSSSRPSSVCGSRSRPAGRISVGALVREAIDARVGAPTLEDRRRAFTAVTAMRGRYLSPEELEALGDDERDRAAPAAVPS